MNHPLLLEDLSTDWVPDALGGAAVPGRKQGNWATEQLRVATATGYRVVPLTGIEFRVWASLASEACLQQGERDLSSRVYGYRDAGTSYRVEYDRLISAKAAMADSFRFLAGFDVASMFHSVDEERVPLAEPLREVLRECRASYSSPLIPGHRWSRRVANLALATVDEALRHLPFVRWQDDYCVGLRTESDFDEASAAFEAALACIGLTGNPQKTKLLDQFAPDAQKLAYARWTDADLRTWDHARIFAGTDSARSKYLLRRMSEARDARAVPYVHALLDQLPVLAPRLAAYLDSVLSTSPDAVAAVLAMANHEDDWIASRAMAVVAKNPSVGKRLPRQTIARHATNACSAVRALAARVQWDRGEPCVESTTRVDAVLRYGEPRWVDGLRPHLTTTL